MRRLVNWFNPVRSNTTTEGSSSKEVVDETKKFMESATRHSLVLVDLCGNELVKFKEFLRMGKYEMFGGGIFNYTWTCPQLSKKNEQYEIKLSSNMDLENIEPPAVNIHEVSLSFVKNGKTLYMFKSQSLGSNYNEKNSSQISSIVTEIGLDQCILSVRSAWNCLIEFLNVSHLLNFESLVYPNEFSFHSNFGVGSSWDETLGGHLITFQSWQNQDFTDVKGFRKSMGKSNPYIVSIEYQNHVLEYVETSISTVSGAIFYQSELKFDSKVFYKAIFPIGNPRNEHYYSRRSSNVKCPAYISGMVVEVDDRDVNHPSMKFAYSILKKFNLEEDERNWIEFVKEDLRGLDLILEKIVNWKSNSFLFACFLKCARQEQVAYSDLVINTFEQ